LWRRAWELGAWPSMVGREIGFFRDADIELARIFYPRQILPIRQLQLFALTDDRISD